MSSRPPLNLKNLLNELECIDDWQGIGIQLEIPLGELKIIKQECHGKVEECKRELFYKWLSRVRNPTWSQIVEALRQMKLNNIAEKIEEKCCHGFSEQPVKVQVLLCINRPFGYICCVVRLPCPTVYCNRHTSM